MQITTHLNAGEILAGRISASATRDEIPAPSARLHRGIPRIRTRDEMQASLIKSILACVATAGSILIPSLLLEPIALTAQTYTNTSVGVEALLMNTGGAANTATGYQSLMANTTGGDNTANGGESLMHNTTGYSNTGIGFGALYGNTSGYSNTAVGMDSLFANTVGNSNAALGYYALLSTTGNGNSGVGAWALANAAGDGNSALGNAALRYATGRYNLALGQNAGLYLKTGDVNILIANAGVDGESNTTRIGTQGNQNRTFISGIRGVSTGIANGVPVMIDSNGQLGTMNSSRRFKEDIQDMAAASDNLLKLRPVTYRYKQPYADGSKPFDYGLIAEEVAEVYPDLVATSSDGQIETVQYQKLTPMLLNEFLKQHEHAAQQDEIIRTLQEANQQIASKLAALESVLAASSSTVVEH